MPLSERDLRTARIASLTFANTLIFQQILANQDASVATLEKAIQSKQPLDVLDKAWTHIINNINYIPIFTLAREILRTLKGTPDFNDQVKELAK